MRWGEGDRGNAVSTRGYSSQLHQLRGFQQGKGSRWPGDSLSLASPHVLAPPPRVGTTSTSEGSQAKVPPDRDGEASRKVRRPLKELALSRQIGERGIRRLCRGTHGPERL